MSNDNYQLSFFQLIKAKLPTHVSLVETIAEQLHISNDSAYRRLRGDKALTIFELQILASFFGISLDDFFGHLEKPGKLLFTGTLIERNKGDIVTYLQGLADQLTYFNSFTIKKMVYINKDIPVFHHFFYPELAAFKCYFWSRYNLNYNHYTKGRFILEKHIDTYHALSEKIATLYSTLPATEVWNLDSITLTIRQINYFEEAKIFESEKDAIAVRTALVRLINRIEDQVEAGEKFTTDTAANNTTGANYTMFINEFSIGDNSVFLELDNQKIVALNHNVINYILTTDPQFVNYTHDSIQHLLKKSSLISEVGEKDRHLFFDMLREKVNRKAPVFFKNE